MKRKLLVLLMAVLVVTAMMPTTVFAQEYNTEGQEYTSYEENASLPTVPDGMYWSGPAKTWEPDGALTCEKTGDWGDNWVTTTKEVYEENASSDTEHYKMTPETTKYFYRYDYSFKNGTKLKKGEEYECTDPSEISKTTDFNGEEVDCVYINIGRYPQRILLDTVVTPASYQMQEWIAHTHTEVCYDSVKYKYTWTLTAYAVAGVTIKDDIVDNGQLAAEVNGNASSYIWYKSDTETGPYEEISGQNGSTLKITSDDARKFFKVKAMTSSNTGIESEVFQIPYYNSIQNSGFETPAYTGYSKNDTNWTKVGYQYDQDERTELVWKTTGRKTITDWSGKTYNFDIEIVRPSNDTEIALKYYNVDSAPEGKQFAELNCEAVGALYQDVLTNPGDVLNYTCMHRGRNGSDTMYIVICNQKDWKPGLEDVRQYVQKEDTAGNTAWTQITGSYTVPAGQYVTRFFFVSGNTAGGSKTEGNFLDAVQFTKGTPTPLPSDGRLAVTKTFSGIDTLPSGYNITVTAQGKEVATFAPTGEPVSDANGNKTYTWTISTLKAGDYTVTENNYTNERYDVTVNGGQNPASASQTVKLEETAGKVGEAAVSFTNTYSRHITETETTRAEITLLKVDSKSNATKLPNAEFKLFKDGNQVGDVRKTGDDGKLSISFAEEGTYTLKETKAPNGYKDSTEEWTIAVTKSEEYTAVDGGFEEKIVYTAAVKSGTVTPSTGTDQDGTYYLFKNDKKETPPPTPTPSNGKLTITKTFNSVDALPDGYNITVQKAGEAAPTTLAINGASSYDAANKTYTWEVNSLEAGTYTVTENNYTKPGYDVAVTVNGAAAGSDPTTNVTLTAADQNVSEAVVAFTNTYTRRMIGTPDKTPATVHVLKVDADDFLLLDEPAGIDGAAFAVTKNASAVAGAIAKGTKTGEIVLTFDEEGTYTLTETAAPANYTKSTDAWTITVEKTQGYEEVRDTDGVLTGFQEKISYNVTGITKRGSDEPILPRTIKGSAYYLFANEKITPEPGASGTLVITKIVKGVESLDELNSYEIFFEIDGTRQENAVQFKNFTQTGADKTYTAVAEIPDIPVGPHTIKESGTNRISGYVETLDPSEKTVTISKETSAQVAFNNTYTQNGGGYDPTPADYALTISKQVVGLDYVPADYAVTVNITNKTTGVVVKTVKLGANETQTVFLPYGEYTLTEVSPAVDGYKQVGQTFSEKDFRLSGNKAITVTNTYEKDAEEPIVDPDPSEPATPVGPAAPDDEDSTEVPKTGDDLPMNLALYAFLAAGAALVMRKAAKKESK